MKLASLWRTSQKVVFSSASNKSALLPQRFTSSLSSPSLAKNMSVLNGQNDIDSLRAKIREQGDLVKRLKEENAPDSVLKETISILKSYKKALDDKEIELSPKDPLFDRAKLEDLLKQKFFYDQSFSIYGGVQGLYDYGPMGCAMKANLLSAWRQFFILEDHLLEVDCSMLTPEPVLQASGHVDRFTDLMVKDVKTGDCFRADHLVKAALEAKKSNKKTPENEKQEIDQMLIQLDNYGADELNKIIRRFDMKSPTTGNDLTEPQEFNLMFSTMIGPTGQCKGYLRPETAQGIFVNFQRLLHFNQGRLPFGAAQIGSAFRNEISPRSGLIRVREFTMAEIEYFVDPTDKSHPKFEEVRDTKMLLYSACDQMSGEGPRTVTIGEAVDKGIVANQTLGYFMARIHLFLIHIGVDSKRLRFRQHLSNEMAHYACDCWDAECQTSYGWIECVGCADRSCYDLNQHSKATGTRLVAEKRLDEPQTVQICECVPNKGELGKVFRGDAKAIIQQLSSLTLDESLSLKNELEKNGKVTLTVNGKQLDVTQSMVQMKEYENVVHVKEIVPNVIEPSFGIGRILYTIFEHSFRVREGDEQRTYLSVSPVLAPYKCSLLPLSNHPDFAPIVRKLSIELTKCGVSHRVDESSGSIGRRYARTDQIAIPYGITVDFDTLNKLPASATLRERDSMKQIRVPLDELPSLVSDIANGIRSWEDAREKYPSFEQQETAEKRTATTTPQPSTNKHPDNLLHSLAKDNLSFDEISKESIEQEARVSDTQHHTIHDSETQSNASKSSLSSKDKCTIHTGKKPLNWTDCGKAIRKRYKEQEEREKILSMQNSVTLSSSLSSDLPRDIDTRSSISGYDADHEDNIGSRLNANNSPSPYAEADNVHQLSGVSPEPSQSILKDEETYSKSSNNITSDKKSAVLDNSNSPIDNLSEWPSLLSNIKPKENLPHHGLFVGDGWPNGNKKESKPNNSHSCAPERNHSSSKSHLPSEPALSSTQKSGSLHVSDQERPEWASLLAQLNQPHFEAEMSQYLDTGSPKVKSNHAPSNKCTTKDNSEVVNSGSTEPSHHGLFVGSGWPSVKSSKKEAIHTSESPDHTEIKSQEMSKNKKTVSNTELGEKANNNDWGSVLTQIPQSLLDSEQMQIGQLNLSDVNAFSTVKLESDTQLTSVPQNPEPISHSPLTPNLPENSGTSAELEQSAKLQSITSMSQHSDTDDKRNIHAPRDTVSQDVHDTTVMQNDIKNTSVSFDNSTLCASSHIKTDAKIESNINLTEAKQNVNDVEHSNQSVVSNVIPNSDPQPLVDTKKSESPDNSTEPATNVHDNAKHTEATLSKDKPKKNKNKHKKKKK
ncbi:unnamed protein product [Trichobilharzia szidati]|nr:unnamed protein product [Trichobilharzia szidati]